MPWPAPDLNFPKFQIGGQPVKNYRKSDYALNKFSEGIVYQFSDGTLEISMEDYLQDNPDKTEGEPVRAEIGDKGFRIAAVGLQTDNAKGYFVEIRAVRL